MSVESRLQRLGLTHLANKPEELQKALEDMAKQIKERQATVGQQATDVIRLAEIDLLQRVLKEEREENMIAVKAPLFKLSQIVATPGAIEALAKNGQSVWEFVSLHASGNWGVVDAEDAEANNQALKDGSRILSAYRLNDGSKIWIITDAEDDDGNRAATTVLTPDEY